MITIYTDGASRGNPGPGGYGAIIVGALRPVRQVLRVVSKVEPQAQGDNGQTVIEIGGREEKTTNNRMEMRAAIEALKSLAKGSEVQIHTDSAYLLNGMTKWVLTWQRNNWITKTKDPVLNQNLWSELLEAQDGKNVSWQKISGHSGHVYNDRCDSIATSFADKTEIKLFSGSAEEYQEKILKHQKTRTVSGKKGPAYSYVSMVEGKIKSHKTWSECEARVKGVKGARYKKATSPEEEAEIKREFQGGEQGPTVNSA